MCYFTNPFIKKKIIFTLIENIDIFISAMIFKTYGYDKNNEDLEKSKFIHKKLYLYDMNESCIKYSIDMLDEILNGSSIIDSFKYSFSAVTENEYVDLLAKILIPDRNALKSNYKQKQFCLSDEEYNNLIRYFQYELKQIIDDYDEHHLDFLK